MFGLHASGSSSGRVRLPHQRELAIGARRAQILFLGNSQGGYIKIVVAGADGKGPLIVCDHCYYHLFVRFDLFGLHCKPAMFVVTDTVVSLNCRWLGAGCVHGLIIVVVVVAI